MQGRGAAPCSRREFPGPIESREPLPSPVRGAPRFAPRGAAPAGLLLRRLALGGCRPRDAEHALHLLLDLRHHRRIVLQEELRVLAALSDLLAVVAVPGAGL